MKYTILLLTTVLLGCSSSSKLDDENTQSAAGDECKIKYHSIKWEFAYCSYKMGITNRYSQEMQSCISKVSTKNTLKTECEKRQYLKKSICNLKVKHNKTTGGAYSCLSDAKLDDEWASKY